MDPFGSEAGGFCCAPGRWFGGLLGLRATGREQRGGEGEGFAWGLLGVHKEFGPKP